MRRVIEERHVTLLAGIAIMMITMLTVPASAGERGPAQPPTAFLMSGCTAGPAPQVERGAFSQHPGSALTVRLASDGTGVLEARVGELEIRKAVQPNGHHVLALQMRNDQVTITANGAVVEVRRGDEAATLDLFGTTEDAFLQTRKVLAGSRAIRAFRTLVMNLDPASEETPATAALMVSDALVGFLDGDVGAVERLGRRFVEKRAARIRPASLFKGPGCFEIYEAEVLRAWKDYQDCRDSFAWWNPLKEGCTLRWLLWAESAWFSFLGCSAIPFAR
jgi:hypothetical protein